jgi:hypothetical protein
MAAWEDDFDAKMSEIRLSEISNIRKMELFRAIPSTIAYSSFGICTMLTAMIYIWTGNELDLRMAVALISLSFTAQTYLATFPSITMTFFSLVQAANRRVTTLLCS